MLTTIPSGNARVIPFGSVHDLAVPAATGLIGTGEGPTLRRVARCPRRVITQGLLRERLECQVGRPDVCRGTAQRICRNPLGRASRYREFVFEESRRFGLAIASASGACGEENRTIPYPTGRNLGLAPLEVGTRGSIWRRDWLNDAGAAGHTSKGRQAEELLRRSWRFPHWICPNSYRLAHETRTPK